MPSRSPTKASCGALQTAPITTSAVIRRLPARILPISIRTPGEHYIPYVIEPSLGCDRVALAFLCEAYDEEVVGKG